MSFYNIALVYTMYFRLCKVIHFDCNVIQKVGISIIYHPLVGGKNYKLFNYDFMIEILEKYSELMALMRLISDYCRQFHGKSYSTVDKRLMTYLVCILTPKESGLNRSKVWASYAGAHSILKASREK